jgi:hypothetical protein
MLDHRRMGHPGVGAPQLLGDIGVLLSQPPHMGLVDHRLVPGGIGVDIPLPVEAGVDDHTFRDGGDVIAGGNVQVPILPLAFP